MSQAITDKMVVTMHYRLSNDKGEILDNSEGSGPLKYLHGAGNIVPGLEKGLEGKTAGDSLAVRVEPNEGYGDVNPDLIQTVDKSVFQGVPSIDKGMMFEAEGSDGAIRRVTVKEVDGDKITIDANHPLAGLVLNFDLDIIEVREAEPEELDHGHAH